MLCQLLLSAQLRLQPWSHNFWQKEKSCQKAWRVYMDVKTASQWGKWSRACFSTSLKKVAHMYDAGIQTGRKRQYVMSEYKLTNECWI